MKKRVGLVVIIMLMCIGFAAISTILIINGNTKVSENTQDFDIYFSKARLDTVDVYNEVISQNKKTITFETNNLSKIGDKSVLEYEVTNNSNDYDAEVSLTCTPTSGEYTSITNELDAKDNIVEARHTTKVRITIKLNKVATEETNEKYTCKLSFTATERDTIGVNLTQFEKDTWATIAVNVKNENTSKYNVGDTKEVDLGELGTHQVRISNMSECTSGETNFETEDKLYLLNAQEVWGNNDYDTSLNSSKQFDYYKISGVTEENSDNAKKIYKNNNSWWWLRSLSSANINSFLGVRSTGIFFYYNADSPSGVSPAFRIA